MCFIHAVVFGIFHKCKIVFVIFLDSLVSFVCKKKKLKFDKKKILDYVIPLSIRMKKNKTSTFQAFTRQATC